MDIGELTINQIRELQSLVGPQRQSPDNGPWEIGKAYLIRTVTHYRIGRVVWVGKQEIVLEEGGWVADTGRYNECIKNGTLGEFEPVDGKMIVGRGAIVDADEWDHAMPRLVK